ncbi:MAG: hypothetical protein E6H01_12685 [Bacillati bacterium ANGP1]|uniref:Uncharacterized protein n=1 Tax=Candidatus Segetimicrobium genomatis TaxID=2569760 RepID=A0A537KQW7_9BACT|nr:MAG: hypothetical protein E6H01_12685 [Terrabacteria group bacterium ANGP1]
MDALEQCGVPRLGKAPFCSVFRADSQRAYVSAMMDGIVIVDVPLMTILGTLPTDGFVACGMIKPNPRADHAWSPLAVAVATSTPWT